MSYEEEAKFFREQFMKQLDYNQHISKQLNDLYLFIMSKAYYIHDGSMHLNFDPKNIDDIKYRNLKGD